MVCADAPVAVRLPICPLAAFPRGKHGSWARERILFTTARPRSERRHKTLGPPSSRRQSETRFPPVRTRGVCARAVPALHFFFVLGSVVVVILLAKNRLNQDLSCNVSDFFSCLVRINKDRLFC